MPASLARMLQMARDAADRFAAEENIEVEWERIWNIEPILFDETLIALADEAVREVSGTSHKLPSGPLHDAAEVARAGIPTVMLFVQSLRGLSHRSSRTRSDEHLELSVRALDLLASKTLERFEASLTAALARRTATCRLACPRGRGDLAHPKPVADVEHRQAVRRRRGAADRRAARAAAPRQRSHW